MIALAVDAWYDGVEERRQQNDYLTQLRADLVETERLMTADYPANSVASLERLLAAYRFLPRPPTDSTRTWFASVGGFNNPVPLTSVAEALVSTGDIRLLPPALRTATLHWLSQARDFRLDPLYRAEDVFRLKLYEVWGYAGLPPTEREESVGDLERFPSGQDLDHVYDDAEVHALLWDLYGLKRAFARYRRGQASDARALREQLDAHLAAR